MDVVLVKDVLNTLVFVNRKFWCGLRVLGLTFALVSCGGEPSQYEPSDVPDSGRPTPIAPTETDGTDDSGDDGSDNEEPSPETPTIVDGIPNVSTGGLQGSDPGVTVNLFGTVEAKGSATITHTLWQQKSGPDVIITNPSRLNTQIITPVVAEETQLVFQLIAQDSEGRVNSSTTAITVQPVTTGAVVEGGVINEGSENAEFIFELLEPVATDTLVKYKTLDGTAEAGMDYTAMEGTILIPAGQSKVSLNVPLLSGDINADAELFYLWITVPDSDGSYTVSGTVVIKSMEPIEDLPVPELSNLDAVIFSTGEAINNEMFTNNGGEQILKCSSQPPLPNGLIVAVADKGASCEISGKPITLSEEKEYTITATNPSGYSLSNITITVDEDAPVVIEQPTLDIPALENITDTISLTLNVPIEPIIFSNSGGEEIIECTARNGVLPAGLNALSFGNPKTSCQITGTPSAVSDETEYGINATNASGTQTSTIKIAVQEQAAGEAPSLVNIGETKTFTLGTVIDDIEFSNVGGFELISCSANGIDLPEGLSFSTTDNKESCKLSGTPLTPSPLLEYAVEAKNNIASSLATISIEILGAGPVLDAPNLVTPANKTFEQDKEITPIVFENLGGMSLSSCGTINGELPNGLIVELFNDGDSCQITGVPSAAIPPTEFFIEAINATATQTIQITIEITEPIVQELAPDLVDIAAIQIFTINTDITPIEFENLGNQVLTNCSVLGAPLPAGLEVNLNSLGTSCVISGSTSVFSLEETEYTIIASSETKMDAATVTILIEEEAVTLELPKLSNLSEQVFTVGDTVDAIIFENTGGTEITQCVSSGNVLPNGLSFDVFGSTSCQLVGSPEVAALRAEYEVTATNLAGVAVASVFITVNEDLSAPILIPTEDSVLIVSDEDIDPIIIFNEGGKELTDCEITPELPPGLNIRVSELFENCEVFGKADNEQNLEQYEITAINSAGQSITELGIEIKQPIILPIIENLDDQIFTVGETILPVSFVNTGGEEISNCSAADETPLPAGLSFVKIGDTTCQLTGTPTTEAPFAEYTVEVSNPAGTTTASVNITVVPAVIPVIAPMIVPSVTGNQIYLTGVSITPITFSNSGDTIVSCATDIAMPIGISFNTETCEISGTPSANRGAVIYTITATNEGGSNSTQISLEVRLSVEAPDLAFGAGVSDNQTFVEGEAISPISFTNNGSEFDDCVASPTLPAGLSVNNETCTISGLPTVPSALTTYTLNASNEGGSDDIQISFSVEEALNAPVITLESTNNQTFTEGEIIAPIVFANIGGEIGSCESNITLPAGLTLNTKTCSISGTPTETKAQTLYILTATNTAGTNSAQVTFEVEAALQAPNLIIVSAPNQTYTEGEDISFLFMSIAGEIDECESGPVPLPAGISVNEKTCNVSGTVTAVQDSVTYSVVAKNAAGSSEKEFTFSVEAALRAPDLVLEVDNDQTFTEGEIITPITFINNGGEIDSCSSNVTMPAGLLLDTKTCEISGTPTGPRIKITYTLNVSNAAGTTSVQVAFDIESALEAPELVDLGSLESPLFFPIDQEITPINFENNGGGSITTCEGALPGGLTVSKSADSATCVISGTPMSANDATDFVITVNNDSGVSSALAFIKIIDYPRLLGQTASFIEGIEIDDLVIANEGGFELSDCASEQPLPAGLSIAPDINNENCVISGKPTEVVEDAVIDITATNIAGSDTNDISITVSSAITIGDLSEKTYTVGELITPVVLATSITSLMKECEINGALIEGLTFTAIDNTCVLSGTPTKAGNSNLEYLAENEQTLFRVFSFSFTVEEAPAPESLTLAFENVSSVDIRTDVHSGNVTVDWGDGSEPEMLLAFRFNSHNYGSVQSGMITLTYSDGLSSVKSLQNNGLWLKLNVSDLESLTDLETLRIRGEINGDISSLTNLEKLTYWNTSDQGNLSGDIKDLPVNIVEFHFDHSDGYISGDINDVKPTLETLYVGTQGLEGSPELTGDLSELKSNTSVLESLKIYRRQNNTIFGDFSGLPDSIREFEFLGNGLVTGDLSSLIGKQLTLFASITNGLTTGSISDLLTTSIETFQVFGENSISGEISDIPPGIRYFEVRGGFTSKNGITGDLSSLPNFTNESVSLEIGGDNVITGDVIDIPSEVSTLRIEGNNVITGNVKDIKTSLTYFNIDGNNTLDGNIEDAHENFSVFHVEGNNTISGDLGKLKDVESPFFIVGGSNTISFSGADLTWAPTSGRVYINLFGDGAGMTRNQTDNFLAYLADVALEDTASTLILDRSGDEGRTSASDGPVAYLESIGFAIDVKLDDYFAGESVYELNCESCHGVLETSDKRNRTQNQIEAAINSIAAMQSIVLNSEEYRVLDYALNNDSP